MGINPLNGAATPETAERFCNKGPLRPAGVNPFRGSPPVPFVVLHADVQGAEPRQEALRRGQSDPAWRPRCSGRGRFLRDVWTAPVTGYPTPRQDNSTPKPARRFLIKDEKREKRKHTEPSSSPRRRRSGKIKPAATLQTPLYAGSPPARG